MPRGGARPNSGPKPGTAKKKTRAIAERAMEEGITPLEVMLDNMRFYHQAAVTAEAPDMAITLRDRAGEAAKDAAPYVHPRLTPTEAAKSTEDHVPLVERIAEYERQARIEKAGNVVEMKR